MRTLILLFALSIIGASKQLKCYHGKNMVTDVTEKEFNEALEDLKMLIDIPNTIGGNNKMPCDHCLKSHNLKRKLSLCGYKKSPRYCEQYPKYFECCEYDLCNDDWSTDQFCYAEKNPDHFIRRTVYTDIIESFFKDMETVWPNISSISFVKEVKEKHSHVKYKCHACATLRKLGKSVDLCMPKGLVDKGLCEYKGFKCCFGPWCNTLDCYSNRPPGRINKAWQGTWEFLYLDNYGDGNIGFYGNLDEFFPDDQPSFVTQLKEDMANMQQKYGILTNCKTCAIFKTQTTPMQTCFFKDMDSEECKNTNITCCDTGMCNKIRITFHCFHGASKTPVTETTIREFYDLLSMIGIDDNLDRFSNLDQALPCYACLNAVNDKGSVPLCYPHLKIPIHDEIKGIFCSWDECNNITYFINNNTNSEDNTNNEDNNGYKYNMATTTRFSVTIITITVIFLCPLPIFPF